MWLQPPSAQHLSSYTQTRSGNTDKSLTIRRRAMLRGLGVATRSLRLLPRSTLRSSNALALRTSINEPARARLLTTRETSTSPDSSAALHSLVPPAPRQLSAREKEQLDDLKRTSMDEALLAKYDPVGILGEGAFAVVVRANVREEYREATSGRATVAVKVMNKRRCPHAIIECELLKSVEHPNVLKYIEHIITDTHVYLVTEELYGPELFTVLLQRDAPFEEETVIDFAEQMFKAVEACHLKQFAHVDVKVENLVFRQPNLSSELVLVDFGAAQKFVRAPYAARTKAYAEGLDDDMMDRREERPPGTILYSSPEVINGLFSSRSDVWSIGVSIYLLLTGRRPLMSMKDSPLEAEKSLVRQLKVHAGDKNTKPVDLFIPPHIASDGMTALLRKLTRGDPKRRCSATEAIEELRELPNYKSPRTHLGYFTR